MNDRKKHPEPPMSRVHYEAVMSEIKALLQQLQRLEEVADRFDPKKPGRWRITRQIRHRAKTYARDIRGYMLMMNMDRQVIEDKP